MEKKATLNFFRKIKKLVPGDIFKTIENDLIEESNDRLEAFWNIIIAGYSVKFAKSSYIQLYEFLKDKPIEYPKALISYVTYPEIENGIYLAKTRWFELN